MTSFVAIELEKLELNVHLGWGEKERSLPQTIFVDIHLSFLKPPLACLTDELDDTICYDDLTSKIKELLVNRSFRLIEYLAAEIYHFIKSKVSSNTNVMLCLTKKPPLPHLAFARIWYGDKKDV